MCGIVGIKFKEGIGDNEKISVVTSLILESSIRGKHATGIAYYLNGRVFSGYLPIDGKSFVEKFPFVKIKSSDTILLHCRYSTSDINYNQPIYSHGSATVHNGVITQESFEEWKHINDMEYSTKNDSEILHNWIIASKDGSIKFPYPSASAACIHLSKEGDLMYFRNGKRPLYQTNTKYGLIITSTKDILKRCNIEGDSELLECLKVYYVGKDDFNYLNVESFEGEDLQKENRVHV